MTAITIAWVTPLVTSAAATTSRPETMAPTVGMNPRRKTTAPSVKLIGMPTTALDPPITVAQTTASVSVTLT